MQLTTNEALTDYWNTSMGTVIDFIPNLAGAAVIMAVGWVVAKTASLILKRLLESLPFDEFLGQGPLHPGGTRATSALVARAAYWILLVLFCVPAAETLQLALVSELISQIVVLLGNLLVAALILVAGLALARSIAGSIERSAEESNLEYAAPLGLLVRYFLTVIVVILALAQTGVRTDILMNVFVVLIVCLGLGLTLSIGFGSRTIVDNLLAGAFARELFTEGETVQVHGRTGKIVSIRSVGTTLDSDGRKITVPNTFLIENIVEE